jgi:hypothetical protein
MYSWKKYFVIISDYFFFYSAQSAPRVSRENLLQIGEYSSPARDGKSTPS